MSQHKNLVAASAGATDDGVVDNPGYLDTIFMFRLAQQICKNYQYFGTYIGLKMHTIEAIKANNSDEVDRAFEVVKAWVYTCEKPGLVTAYNKLCDALKEIGRSDLVDLVRIEATKKSACTPTAEPTETERRLLEKISQVEGKLQSLNKQLLQAKKEGFRNDLNTKLEEEAKSSNGKTKEQILRANEKMQKANEQIKESKEEDVRLLQDASKQGQSEEKSDEKYARTSEPMDTLRVAAQPVKGESEDHAKRRTLNIIHSIRRFQQPELWSHVSALLLRRGQLDVSGVITKDNLVDVEYLLTSGVASDVTALNLGGDLFGRVDVFGDEEDVQRLCRGLEAMPQLEKLRLGSTNLTNAGMARVCRTIRSRCHHLTLLNCMNNALTGAVKTEVTATMRDMSGLKIDIHWCRLPTGVCRGMEREFDDRIHVGGWQLR